MNNRASESPQPEGNDDAPLVLWERRRWYPLLGWHRPLFTAGWKDSNGRPAAKGIHPGTKAYRKAMTRHPEALQDWDWRIVTRETTDAEGWQYASHWRALRRSRLGFHKQELRSDLVRKRQWVHKDHIRSLLANAKKGAVHVYTPRELAEAQTSMKERAEAGMQDFWHLTNALDGNMQFKTLVKAVMDPVAVRAVMAAHRKRMEADHQRALAELPRATIAATEQWGDMGTAAAAAAAEEQRPAHVTFDRKAGVKAMMSRIFKPLHLPHFLHDAQPSSSLHRPSEHSHSIRVPSVRRGISRWASSRFSLLRPKHSSKHSPISSPRGLHSVNVRAADGSNGSTSSKHTVISPTKAAASAGTAAPGDASSAATEVWGQVVVNVLADVCHEPDQWPETAAVPKQVGQGAESASSQDLEPVLALPPGAMTTAVFKGSIANSTELKPHASAFLPQGLSVTQITEEPNEGDCVSAGPGPTEPTLPWATHPHRQQQLQALSKPPSIEAHATPISSPRPTRAAPSPTAALQPKYSGWRSSTLLTSIKTLGQTMRRATGKQPTQPRVSRVPASATPASTVHTVGGVPTATGRMQLSEAELDCALRHAMCAYGDPDNRFLRGYYATIEKHTGVPEQDVLMAVWRSQAFFPGHYVAVDHARRKIVIAIRGTAEGVDKISDLVSHPVVMDFGPGLLGVVHKGIMDSAQNVYNSVVNEVILAAGEHPDYTIFATGHSLGGGVAPLLTLLFRRDERLSMHHRQHIRAYCLAPAAVMNRVLALACQPFVASIIYGSDIVPRVGVRNVAKFAQQVAMASPLQRALLALGKALSLAKTFQQSVNKQPSSGSRDISTAADTTMKGSPGTSDPEGQDVLTQESTTAEPSGTVKACASATASTEQVAPVPLPAAASSDVQPLEQAAPTQPQQPMLAEPQQATSTELLQEQQSALQSALEELQHVLECADNNPVQHGVPLGSVTGSSQCQANLSMPRTQRVASTNRVFKRFLTFARMSGARRDGPGSDHHAPSLDSEADDMEHRMEPVVRQLSNRQQECTKRAMVRLESALHTLSRTTQGTVSVHADRVAADGSGRGAQPETVSEVEAQVQKEMTVALELLKDALGGRQQEEPPAADTQDVPDDSTASAEPMSSHGQVNSALVALEERGYAPATPEPQTANLSAGAQGPPATGASNQVSAASPSNPPVLPPSPFMAPAALGTSPTCVRHAEAQVPSRKGSKAVADTQDGALAVAPSEQSPNLLQLLAPPGSVFWLLPVEKPRMQSSGSSALSTQTSSTLSTISRTLTSPMSLFAGRTRRSSSGTGIAAARAVAAVDSDNRQGTDSAQQQTAKPLAATNSDLAGPGVAPGDVPSPPKPQFTKSRAMSRDAAMMGGVMAELAEVAEQAELGADATSSADDTVDSQFVLLEASPEWFTDMLFFVRAVQDHLPRTYYKVFKKWNFGKASFSRRRSRPK